MHTRSVTSRTLVVVKVTTTNQKLLLVFQSKRVMAQTLRCLFDCWKGWRKKAQGKPPPALRSAAHVRDSGSCFKGQGEEPQDVTIDRFPRFLTLESQKRHRKRCKGMVSASTLRVQHYKALYLWASVISKNRDPNIHNDSDHKKCRRSHPSRVPKPSVPFPENQEHDYKKQNTFWKEIKQKNFWATYVLLLKKFFYFIFKKIF